MEASFEDAGSTPEPPAAALSMITTEHFVLQGARAATISESTGRAGMFLSAVSGGLVALGLIATASRVGSGFYAFGLALLPTLALIGLMTFQRVLQSGVEDHGYARRISRLRVFYFERVPQLAEYMSRVPAEEGTSARGLSHGRGQGFLTTAGMVAVVTAVLVGGFAGLLCSGPVRPSTRSRAQRRCGGRGRVAGCADRVSARSLDPHRLRGFRARGRVVVIG
jgi:hypothetical protein